MEWATRLGGARRLADTPNDIHRVLAPAREEYRTSGKIPAWCGVELLRAWALLLAQIDRRLGGGTLGAEWRHVLQAIRSHPAARVEDMPPAPGLDPDSVQLPAAFAEKPQRHGDKDGVFLEKKRARLRELHVAPINDLVDSIREERGTFQVPYVDPDSGGIAARVLLVFESPVIVARDSGMLSPDNKEAVAKNVWAAYRASGLSRARTVHWNVVPWFTGTPAGDAARAGLLVEAQPYLVRMLALLPDLRAVVAAGPWAQVGTALNRRLLDERGVVVLPAPVPRQAGAAGAEAQKAFTAAFRTAKLVAER